MLPALAATALLAASPNPCLDPAQAESLRCPDLRMKPAYDLFVDRRERRGRALLAAANSIDSRGDGPVELRGRRTSSSRMTVTQLIHRQGGGKLALPGAGRLGFKFIPGQGRYWKFIDAAKFELWSIDGDGQRVRRVRTGPKLVYCFRDLQRSAAITGSPRREVYPACSRSPRKRSVTLGTSVGWSDVYPSTYHENWIDVTGLRGCFAFVHIADPQDNIAESDETNNASQITVRLPYRGGRRGCPAPADGASPPWTISELSASLPRTQGAWLPLGSESTEDNGSGVESR